jgi:hypothetical protein
MSHSELITYRLEDTRHILECMELASLQATKANGALQSRLQINIASHVK